MPALATALLGGAAVVLAVALLTSDGGAEVDRNAFIGRGGLIAANNSPSAARNPRDRDNVVVVNRVDRPRFTATLHWSRDGGRSWRATALPLPEGKDRPYAPDAAFASDGTLYVTYVNLAGRGNQPENLWIARSRDGGRTLAAPERVINELNFQSRLTVGPSGDVHITYLRTTDVGTLSFFGPVTVVATRSSDGGRTFSKPVLVSDGDRPRVGAASPVVDSDGDVVVLYEDFKEDVRDFANLSGPPWNRPFALVVSRSTDGGRTFSRGVEIESRVVPTKRFLVFLPEFPSLAAGPDGSLVVAWADGRSGDEDVFARRSADGRAWSEPVRVNDNPVRDGTAQSLPRAAVAPNGRIDVLFLDRRRDPRNVRTDAFLASSADDGESFDNVRLSSRSFDSRVGPRTVPYLEPDLGSRLGLASDDDEILAAWTDTRLGSEATGRQDIVGTPVEPGKSQAGARLLVGALLVSSVIALGAWRLQARASLGRVGSAWRDDA